jgi:hypothetical protein
MGSRIQCFLLVPSDFASQELRRYAESNIACPASGVGYHNATALLERIPWDTDGVNTSHGGRGIRGYSSGPLCASRADSRWPAACACGYVFAAGDRWQHNVDRLFRRADVPDAIDGELVDLDHAPPGAMWNAYWYNGIWNGPDGVSLEVMTPGGVWLVDGPSRNSKQPWSRSGELPAVTANPSISIGVPERYHGWLRDGWLEEC